MEKMTISFPLLQVPEFWVCLGTFVFVGSGHVGVSMFYNSYKIDHFDYSWRVLWQIYEIWFFLWKIIHIEPLTNTINTILWCIWIYLGKKSHPSAVFTIKIKLWKLSENDPCKYLWKNINKKTSHVLFWDLFGMCRRQSLDYVDRVMHEPDKSLICLTDCEKTMYSNIYYSLQLQSCLLGYDVKCK